jgi:dTDP-4-amino-4,6-dideoxygalactose transaminase
MELRARREHLARAYRERLKQVPFLELPVEAPAGDEHAWHLFPVRLRPNAHRLGRDQFITELGERGVSTSVHFIPVHRHSFYRVTLGYEEGRFPGAERAYANIISLPLYTRMTDEDIDYVTEQIHEVGRTDA